MQSITPQIYITPLPKHGASFHRSQIIDENVENHQDATEYYGNTLWLIKYVTEKKKERKKAYRKSKDINQKEKRAEREQTGKQKDRKKQKKIKPMTR